jgi:hypothetical protein
VSYDNHRVTLTVKNAVPPEAPLILRRAAPGSAGAALPI